MAEVKQEVKVKVEEYNAVRHEAAVEAAAPADGAVTAPIKVETAAAVAPAGEGKLKDILKGKRLGKGGAKRHRKVLRDNIQASLSRPSAAWLAVVV